MCLLMSQDKNILIFRQMQDNFFCVFRRMRSLGMYENLQIIDTTSFDNGKSNNDVPQTCISRKLIESADDEVRLYVGT